MFPRNWPGWGDAGSPAGRGDGVKEKPTAKRTQERSVSRLNGDPSGKISPALAALRPPQLCTLGSVFGKCHSLGGIGLCLSGEGPTGSSLCATSAERDIISKGTPPSLSHAPRFYPLPGPQQVSPRPVAPEELYRRAGPGRALSPQRDRGPQEEPPPPWDQVPRPGEAPRESSVSWDAQAPGSAPVSH